ncbi:Endoglucanase 8 [Citrus sinensis]|nr:Endoglucanase 8 [Citrus sinensis]
MKSGKCMIIQILLGLLVGILMVARVASHDYGDALSKCILFFEGQRSGKLPSTQRMTWRKDSALSDGSDVGVDLVGGYYDAGDNIKFSFPMAFSTTMLAWSILEFGHLMGSEHENALESLKWSTDYFLKATSVPGKVVAAVGNPKGDHNCWERPEDMDIPRTSYLVNTTKPGSEVSAEIAAALAASSMVFKSVDSQYSNLLLQRAFQVFQFADQYQGSYNYSVGEGVCPFYCDYDGYMDELIWGAAWLFKATNEQKYWNYVVENIHFLENSVETESNKAVYVGGCFADFGWDGKNAGINVLISRWVMNTSKSDPFVSYADKFFCTVLPESPTRWVTYSPGGLMFKYGAKSIVNSQHVTATSFLLLVYSQYLTMFNRNFQCGDVAVSPSRLVQLAKVQVDYVLGSNSMGMSFMVGYGQKFPQRIHHRGSTLPSIDKYPKRLKCHDGDEFFETKDPNLNVLTGAIVGGPDINDKFEDDRMGGQYINDNPNIVRVGGDDDGGQRSGKLPSTQRMVWTKNFDLLDGSDVDGLESALEEEDPEAATSSVTDDKKRQIQNRAHSTLILSLGDSILREIFEEKIALGIWNKVEALCMKKSLAHRLFLKKRDCLEKKKKESQEKSRDVAVASDDASNGYHSVDLLVTSNSNTKESGGLEIRKGTEIVMKGVKENDLYVLQGSSVPIQGGIFVVSEENIIKLWHLRLGHMSVKMQEFSKQELLGSAQVPSLSGGKYFMSLIDDYSRNVWVYILKIKDQALEKFKVWKSLVENQSGFKFKCLRTDNGLEFCSKEFEEYCQKHGIKRHKTVRFTPQHNGLAERMNKTLVDKTRYDSIINKQSETSKVKVELFGDKDRENEVADYEERTTVEVKEHESSELPDLQTYQLARDRVRREVRAPVRYGYANLIAYALLCAVNMAIEEHANFSEAIESMHCDKWLEAMQDEMESLQRNQTWTLVPNPAMVALLDLELEQMDVKTTFFHGNLEEQILMAQYKGFECKGNEYYVCLLHKSLYGLKQSSRQWYRRFDDFIVSKGYHKSKYDSCVYFGGSDQGGVAYLLLYVDDMLIASKYKLEIERLKNLLKAEFEMKDLGSAKRILMMDITRDRYADTLFLSQEKYIKKVLEMFEMQDCKPVQTPFGPQFKLTAAQSSEDESQVNEFPYAHVVGSLMYAMVYTRSYIAYAVSVISRFLSCPNKVHWNAVKWIMRYLKSSSNCGLLYGKTKSDINEVMGFVDSYFSVVALSSIEAEFITTAEAVKEAMWLRGLLNELWLNQKIVQVVGWLRTIAARLELAGTRLLVQLRADGTDAANW